MASAGQPNNIPDPTITSWTQVISYPAPLLCQHDDAKLLLEIAEIVLPGSLRQYPNENGLRIWVDGDSTGHPEAGRRALAKFQISLGVLRAWRTEAGRLANEERRGLGPGSVRDETGNQYMFVGAILVYSNTDDALLLAAAASRGITASRRLENCLWIYGRESRTSADYYMIHEYAKQEFSGPTGVANNIGVSATSQSRLTRSINNMSPLEGGRHAIERNPDVPMDLDVQAQFVGDLLRAWIGMYA
jgi:hypothetical protein